MKAIALIVGVVLGLAGLIFAFTHLGAPALLLVGALLGAGLLLAQKVRTDPYVGWGYLRAFAVMATLALVAWTAMAFLSGSLIFALPLAVASALGVWCITQCTRRIKRTVGTAPTEQPANEDLSPSAQNLVAANALTDQIIDNHGRSQARGRALHLQGENLDLIKRNRELEGEVERLRRQVADLDGALHDPFYDPIAKA